MKINVLPVVVCHLLYFLDITDLKNFMSLELVSSVKHDFYTNPNLNVCLCPITY